jgi:hypothetical protein
MDNWLLVQNFYHGLTNKAQEKLNVAGGGAFMSLTIDNSIALVEKMCSNQVWYEECLQTQNKALAI